MRAGLKSCDPRRGQPVVNSISLERLALLEPVSEAHVNLVNAQVVAQEWGLEVTESRSTAHEQYANLVTVRVSPDGPDVEDHVLAATVAWGEERIVRVDHYLTDFAPRGHILLARNLDRPGMIGRVGTLLGSADINIAAMQVARDARGNILADAKAFLEQLLGALAARKLEAGPRLAEWHERIAGWKKEWDAFTRPNFDIHASPMRPERVVADCRAVLSEDAIISLDSGVHHNWYMQFWNARRPQAMLNTWGYSGMGFGPSSILGAKLAAPDKVCVSICGDGGFTMVPHVLCTAVEYNIAAVWVVWNNFSWAAIRDIQYGLFNGREIGTGFYEGPEGKPYNPDFAAWARASGVEGITVKKSQDFAGALEHAIRLGKPCLVDVHVDANIRPPATGAWALPPIPHKEPVFGAAHVFKETQ